MIPLLVVQSTDAMQDQDVDVTRGGVLCILAEWSIPQCYVLGSVSSIPSGCCKTYLVTA